MKPLSDHQLRRRFQTQIDDESITQQDQKNLCDINLIIDQYRKTGTFPNVQVTDPIYGDVSEIPTFEEAHAAKQTADALFMELPLKIRLAVEHDPKKLEAYLSDSENYKELVKLGLFKETKKPKINEPEQQTVELLKKIQQKLTEAGHAPQGQQT